MSPQREVARDRISNLPDEILGKILSMLWTNRAASTSVLSKRWRNLLAHVDTLEFNDASGTGPRDFPDFVDKTLSLPTNSRNIKSISFKLTFDHDPSRVNAWIRTALDLGCSQLNLENVRMHRVQTEFFRSNTLVDLTICDWFYPQNCLVPRGTVIFPSLKTLSLISIRFQDVDTYKDFISACPLLEDLSLDYSDDDDHSNWTGVVSSPSIKNLTIIHNHPRDRDAHEYVLFETPSLVYLDYSSYVADQYEVNLASLIEARLNLRPWEPLIDDEDESDSESDSESDTEDIFGDVTDLVAGISNVKTLHLSSDSLEVFHFCCESMPVFHNLQKLSFESEKEKGWQVLPLLLNNSPNLKTLVIKGLVHKVTDRCGDACTCIRKKNEVCCLSTCQVEVLSISAYRGTCRELKLMKHFLANLKSLQTVKVGVKMSHKEDDSDVNNRYLRITNALMKLPRVSSNCHIHFF